MEIRFNKMFKIRVESSFQPGPGRMAPAKKVPRRTVLPSTEC